MSVLRTIAYSPAKLLAASSFDEDGSEDSDLDSGSESGEFESISSASSERQLVFSPLARENAIVRKKTPAEKLFRSASHPAMLQFQPTPPPRDISLSPTNYTLIIYCPDPLGVSKKQLFVVPNNEIDSYMRDELTKAHKSTVGNNLYRACNCVSGKCLHPMPDFVAKFVSVFVLDSNAPVLHKSMLIKHLKQPGALRRGEWEKFRIANNSICDFTATPLLFIYTIDLYI